MAKMIGLSRAIKPEWLNKTVQLVIEGTPAEEIKQVLDEDISLDIKSPDNIRKSRDILMNLWVHPFDDEKRNEIRGNALSLIKEGTADILAMHWCMLLLAYPVFADVTGMIGKIGSMQDSFSFSWLKEKMFEAWGERSTLFHSVEKIMQTLRQLEVISSEKGIYTMNKHKIEDRATIELLTQTILSLKMKAYYEPAELSCIPQMFPFEYDVDSDMIFGSEKFKLGNFGGNPVVIG